MREDPPFETISFMVRVLLSSSAAPYVRRFAVGKYGKKRELWAAGPIAKAIGPRLLYPLHFHDGDWLATEAEITSEVEAILLSVRDDLAAMLVSKNIGHADAITQMIGKMVAKRLMRKYQVERADRTADWLKPDRGDGKA